MSNKKVVHIVNSSGFLRWIKQSFDEQPLENQYVLFHPSGTNSKKIDQDVIQIINTRKDRSKLLDIINQSDIAIHYFLNVEKAELILKSSSHVKHYWYFFGADVYQQFPQFKKTLYGPNTEEWIGNNWKEKHRLTLRNIKRWMRCKSSVQRTIQNSFTRIDKVLWYVDEEIKWIDSILGLPSFKYFKFFNFSLIYPYSEPQLKTSQKIILIGNSSTAENNHLDLIDYLVHLKKDISLVLPLNYGDVERYGPMVKSEYLKLDNSKIYLDEFMPLEEYNSLMSGCETAIMFHFRQQALGNIFYLLANGTKVYLSEKNIIYRWLLNNGICVFSVESDFIEDAQQNNLNLDLHTQSSNFQCIKQLLTKRSDFINSIL